MTEHNNPPAFPRPASSVNVGQPGMTLLDHFAGLAMQTFIGNDDSTFREDAYCAYEMADAMLKERQKWIK